jgi:rhomboid family protein
VTPWVMRLLIANIGVYFLELTAPQLVRGLVFVPALVLSRPWTVVTYMFLHDPSGFMHIAFNMIALYFFGPRVEERLGPKRFITLYFISGLSGALLSAILAFNSAILGASAAVFGVMLAFAWFWPNEQIYIWGVLPVRARVLVIVSTLFTLYSGFRGSRGGVADFAHLGGYVGAFAYLWWLKRTQELRTAPFRVPTPTPQAEKQLANWRAIDTRSVHEVNRDEVNRILDKISASGVQSLTPQERTFLSNFVPADDRVPPPS